MSVEIKTKTDFLVAGTAHSKISYTNLIRGLYLKDVQVTSCLVYTHLL